MRRLVSLVCATAFAAVLVVAAPTPASANGVCAGATGTATLSTPLVYPGVELTPRSAAFAVGFSVGACLNITTAPPGAVVKSLTATGTLNGYCGTSSGTGVTGDGHSFSWVSAGTFLLLTGGLQGVVSAIPDAVNGESCLTGADVFVVSGVAVKQHCVVELVFLQPTALLHYWTRICVVSVL